MGPSILAATLAVLFAAPAPAVAPAAPPAPAPSPAPAALAASTPASPDAASAAPAEPARVAAAATPLPSGSFGTLTLPALALPEPGHVSLSLGGDFYRGGEFLLPGTTTQRTTVALAASAGVLAWLEVYGAVGFRAASSSSDASSRSLRSLGDSDLGVKAVFPAAGPLTAGALVQLDLPAGVDSMSAKGLGGRVLGLAALGGQLGPVPLVATLALGYVLDNSGRLVEEPGAGGAPGRRTVATLPAFALDLSLYDRVTGGLSVQSPLRYASPTLELAVESPVARDVVLPAGGHPVRARLVLGAAAIGLGVPGLQASAGLQLSLVRTGRLSPDTLAMPGFAPDPPWAFKVGVAWSFEPQLPQRAKDLRWRGQPKELPGADEGAPAHAGPGAPPKPGGAEVVPAAAEGLLAGAHLSSITAAPVPVDQGRLSLLLVDARTQQPVPGAWVSLLESADKEATTSADGRARLDVLPGSLTLAVAKDGFEPTTQSVTAVAGQNRHITLQLQPVQADCTVKGHLAAEDGEPLRVSLQAALQGASTPPAEAQLFEGRYSLSLPHGQWALVVTAPGYRAERVEVELLPGETRAKDVVLKRVAGEPLAALSPQGAELSKRMAFLPLRAQLLPASMAPLEELAKALQALTGPLVVGVRVEPLDLGTSADDAVAALKLGEERAQAIVELLVAKGVPKHLLLPRGLGLAQPGQPTLELRLVGAGGKRTRSLTGEP